MIQILREEPIDWPADGPPLTGQVSPTVARRRASGYLGREVAMTLLARNPRLVVGERAIWRFDVDLNLPDFGRIATLGTIDVDAGNADVLPLTRTQIHEMLKNANALVLSQHDCIATTFTDSENLGKSSTQ